jgi:hypothetical protein
MITLILCKDTKYNSIIQIFFILYTFLGSGHKKTPQWHKGGFL